jgi:hypothetical protein
VRDARRSDALPPRHPVLPKRRHAQVELEKQTTWRSFQI